MVYRKLAGYKYLLLLDYAHWAGTGDLHVEHNYFTIEHGRLCIRRGYAWDGPSGPTIDTKDFMIGSLVHDVLYQAMREGLIDTKQWKSHADKLLYQICVDEGMPKWRASYVYLAVKLFGPKYKKGGRVKKSEVFKV